MEGAGFRSLIIFLLLAIFAFVAGSLASDDAQGALIPSALILGAFFLIYLGKNCWILVFIVPPILMQFNLGKLSSYPLPFVVCAVVLIYMVVLSMMGYMKLKWQSFWTMDITAAILVIYCLSTWVRHPVTIRLFTSITDYGYADVGGSEYFWCVGSVFAYVAISVIAIKLETLIKVLKWSFFFLMGTTLFNSLSGGIGGGLANMEGVTTSRFFAFIGISFLVFQYILFKYPLSNIIFSPWKLVLLLFSCIGIFLSGFRTYLIQSSISVFVVSFFHRQLMLVIMLALSTWGGLVYLSHEQVLDDLPYGVKRTLSVVPGVEFEDAQALKDANQSSEWRLEMWKWALDPSKGYIQDYVWGDGFGMSEYREHLRRVSVGLGLIKSGDNKLFAARGVWHNAAITVLQEMGGVGLSLVVIWFVIVITCFNRVGLSLRNIEGKEFIYLQIIPLYAIFLTFFFLVGGTQEVFSSYYYAALGKLVYIKLKEENKLTGLFVRKEYRPLIMRE